MSLTRSEFKVLQALSNTGEPLTQSALSDDADLPLEAVDAALG